MYTKLNRLKDRVAIITGAAQGIGRSIAEVLAAEGAAVVIADLQDGKGEQVTDLIKKDGGKAAYIRADVSQEQDIQKMIDYAVKTFGFLDILVNNAAPSRRKQASFLDTMQDWDLHSNILLKSHVLAALCAVPHMHKRGGGSIVNIASVTAFAITQQPCIYHVAKAGVVQLTNYLAYEYGPMNIRTNCVCPGLVDRDEGIALTDNPINKTVVELAVPLRRAARPREIGHAVLFLCSDEASYINGLTLTIDGGLTLGEPFEVARRAYQLQLATTMNTP